MVKSSHSEHAYQLDQKKKKKTLNIFNLKGRFKQHILEHWSLEARCMFLPFFFIQIMVWKEMEYGCMSESEKQMLVSEVNLLRELKHQYIVRYYDRIIDRSRAIIYIIMEYCSGGDLATIISRNRKEG